MPTLDFVWLEVTRSCQLTCIHCHAESSPQGTHGAMTSDHSSRSPTRCGRVPLAGASRPCVADRAKEHAEREER